jgi:oligopeptide/dipeptide ABC transporter ATP-binding protein
MYAGRLMELAGNRELFNDPRHPYTIGLLESIPKKRGILLQPIPGVVPRPEDLPAGCKFMDRCRYAIGECGIREPELREFSSGHLVRCIRAEEITWNY